MNCLHDPRLYDRILLPHCPKYETYDYTMANMFICVFALLSTNDQIVLLKIEKNDRQSLLTFLPSLMLKKILPMFMRRMVS